jgi:hypothetical protein
LDRRKPFPARHRAGCIAATLFSFLLLDVPTVRAEPAQDSPQREWTVMIYMNGKNNLEPDSLNNFHAISSIGGTDKVAIVVELGRPKKPTKADGHWSGVYRFLVGLNTPPRPESAVEKVASGTASDMGRRETLSDFIKWSKSKYPAKHFMLVVWNHGQGYRLTLAMLATKLNITPLNADNVPAPGLGALGGFRAISSDDDTGSIMYNAEVEQAIVENFGSNKLDLVGFDACLMSMIETGYALKSSTGLMVGSEELEPGDGWQYAKWLDKLVASPEMDARQIGQAVVDSYGSHYADSYFTTMSLIDLAKVGSSSTKLTQLSDAILKQGSSELTAMRSARAELASYGDWDQPPFHLSIDLMTLLERYRSKTSNQMLQKQVDELSADLSGIVLANYASKRSQGTVNDGLYGSKGVAIYYPATVNDFRSDYFHTGYLKKNTDRPVQFVREEHWADLLYALLGIK